MGNKSKQPQRKKKKKWDLGSSQRQLVAQIVTRQNEELNMLRRHHGRELTQFVNTLREELGIPQKIKLGLDMQNPEKMFVREISEAELKAAAAQMAQQTNGDQSAD